MKKLFIVMSLAWICGSVVAQEATETPSAQEAQTANEMQPAKEWKVKGFEPQVRVFLDEGMDKQKNWSFGADFIASYRFNEIVRIGGGVGLQYSYLRYGEPAPNTTDKGNYKESLAIPIFANIKVDFLKRKVSPFFAADCGYMFHIPGSGVTKDNKLGFFVRPSIGIDIRFRKCVLCIDIAYKYQARSFDNGWDEPYKGYHQISQSVAVSF